MNNSKKSIVLSYHESQFHIINLSIILSFFGKSLTDHDSQGPPKKLAPCLAEPHLTDRRYKFSLEKQTKNLTLTLHLSS